MPPTFIFVRHGEAAHNVAQRHTGDSAYSDPAYIDAPLTEKGKEQAAAIKGLPSITVCYTSPLTRCIQTAVEIKKNAPFKNFIAEESLIECQGGGHICNRRMEEHRIAATFKGLRVGDLGPVQLESKRRETFGDVRQRVVPFLRGLLGQFRANETILIITHHDVLFSLVNKSIPNAGTLYMCADELKALIKP